MRIAALLLISMLLVVGCVPLQTEVSPLPAPITAPDAEAQATGEPEPTAVVPDPTKASLTGTVVSTNSIDLTGRPVTLAQVFWNDDKSEGAFVVDAANSPTVLVQADGTFAFHNVLPEQYVIVVGDPTASNAVVSEPDGTARVITLEAGQTFEAGRLEVTLTH